MSNLDDVKVKGIPVELKGETYYLKFDLNSFAELEDRYGSITKAMKKFEGEIEYDDNGDPLPALDEQGKEIIDEETGRVKPRRSFSIKLLRTILWAGLIHANPELTETQVGAMIDFGELVPLMNKTAEAMQAAMPKLTKEEQAIAERNMKLEQAKTPPVNFPKEVKKE